MSKVDELSKTYVRFLNLLEAIKGMPSMPTLDAVEEKVLGMLAALWVAGERVTVLQAMGLPADSSPTTVHRRLKSLRSKGLIRLEENEADNRTKFVLPTDLGRGYLAKLGQCVEAAAKAG